MEYSAQTRELSSVEHLEHPEHCEMMMLYLEVGLVDGCVRVGVGEIVG